ncbi:PTS mannose/fructose/sorbose/N-acetylgalactosamine transporter subunit IIC [Alicyclobacillus dauci]|uniref:PTS sugar transporter subunit IIC n=1 Tax=Alicyclobacillus dauci TaxID=1475485 RepID=A0ABY6YZM1_9BACL|nr:PTS sugar transporter subunit IIC [Alicyclobacillus dauci]WAH36032.1 PTS sugar transporter subunit IIC [Alicyclobacillus dauci]
MASYSIWIALVLGILAYLGIVLNLGPGLWLQEALVVGVITGLIVGNVHLGLVIGGTLTLMSLGMWTYGGATMPDFMTGAILGTAIGALGGGETAGLAVAIPASILMTQLDVLGRAVTTVFIHAADKYAERGDTRGVTWMHLLGQLPWGLTRMIPVFIAVWLGAGPIQHLIGVLPQWFMHGMHVTGVMLPALGFALLLNQMPLKKHWAFLLIGYILYAYLNLPIIGVALAALAGAALYLKLRGSEANAES